MHRELTGSSSSTRQIRPSIIILINRLAWRILARICVCARTQIHSLYFMFGSDMNIQFQILYCENRKVK